MEFEDELKQYVQEFGQIVYGDGVNWSKESNGLEPKKAMILNIESLECRHISEKLYSKDDEFICSDCQKVLVPKEYREK